MEYEDIIMTLAVILGPIAAVQIQKWLEQTRNEQERKLELFKTLMSTRATRVSIEHVQSLNMIDIEFNGKGYEHVITAWRNYHDHLSNGDSKSTSWMDKNDDLFIELLYEMGTSLNYTFDKVMLRRTAYSPIAHGDIELDQQAIRRGLATILSGNAAFPVFFTNNVGEEKPKQAKK
ncbi:MAG: hypothetical protein RLN88_06290 [Ekhidna sp.]|uniref:DUF6680 family protein n=1 Tax=Ekhidna sp. TaxID=2608089 RepID=UPI0032EB2FA6